LGEQWLRSRRDGARIRRNVDEFERPVQAFRASGDPMIGCGWASA